MYPFYFILTLLLLSLSADRASGQTISPPDSLKTILTGHATDAASGLPLTGAHAFIGSTLIGTATDLNGAFELKHLPIGTHTLWISMIGYVPASQLFTVTDTTTLLSFDLSLEPAIIEVGELTVTAKRDRRWKKRLNQFIKMFIGESDFAREARIMNAESLDFDANWLGRFEARANAPLIIENHALGYRVEYVLKEFSRKGSTIRYDGDPLFVELEPETPELAAWWAANREEAFYGSFHHFLLSLLNGTTEDEGFRVLRMLSIEDISRSERKFPMQPHHLIEIRNEEKLLSFNGVLEIIYDRAIEEEAYLKWKGASPHKPPSEQRSWIRLTTGPTAIDPNGEIIDPYGVTVYGYYAYLRMANDLPKEYRPPKHTDRP